MLQSTKTSMSQLLRPDLSLMKTFESFVVLDRGTICTDWYRLWCSFGFSEHQWFSRAAKVEEYTRKVLNDKLVTYKEQLIKRRQLLEQSLDEYEDLIERTGLSPSIEALVFDELKLKEQEIYLDRKMQELLINEDQLIHRRKELENKQQYLCTLLNTPPVDLDLSFSLLLINQKLHEHLKMLSELKDQRLTQVTSYYLKLKEYSEQLEWTPASPSSTVEYLLLEQFDRCLTADCLNEIESSMHELANQIERQKSRFFILYDQLSHLYKRLGKDPNKDYSLAFKTGSENINAFVIRQLEYEIACCREERMKNGREYCHLMHQQIRDLLEKAQLGVDERITLEKLDFEPLSPELLDAYDAEYERTSQLYEKRKPVLDAYQKWLSFWNEFVAFTKTSTDPGRFHVRGYNAEIEARQRKKFHRELPIIEQEFLSTLADHNDPPFRIDHVPIRQKFDEAHQQIPATTMPLNTPGRTPAPARLLAVTPLRSRTPVTTPRRVATKEPFVLGTAVTSTARRVVKTPAAHVARKLLNKVSCRTEGQPTRAKPRAPPTPVLQSSPPHSVEKLPVHPPACTGDQSLDFSLLHTMKNVYGQMKIMTSTPNSSLVAVDTHDGKTAHNTIDRRKSQRRSKRTPLPLLIIEDTDEETIVCL